MVEHFEVSSKTHTIHALIETDVTFLKETLGKKQRLSGKGLSIQAYIIFLFAHLLSKHKGLIAFRKGRTKLVVFDEVDIFTVVERRSKGQKSIPVGAILRDAGSKCFEEINDLLRNYQKADPLEIPGVKERRELLKYPSFIRKRIFRYIDRNPFLFKKYYGTAAVSSLSFSFGNRAWWGIPISAAPLMLMPSGFYKKVVMEQGVPVEKQFMSLTVSMNHDTIDGAPAQRFLKEFVEKFENAYGL